MMLRKFLVGSIIGLQGLAVLASAATTHLTQTIKLNPKAVAVVDATGAVVAQPTVALPVTTVEVKPQIISAILGTANQTLRIVNPSLDTPWSVTMAATLGPTALWTGNGDSYDFNDTVDGTDGPDPDHKGGSLVIDPSPSSITGLPNNIDCAPAGLSLGSATRFQETVGDISSITLINGSALFATYCQWDVTGIKVQQVVPSAQPSGNYNLDFTLTII